jgi:hypothetical protein
VHAGVGIVVVSGMCVAALYAQQPATSSASTLIDVSKLGSQVGERVPDFSLPDQNGKVYVPAIKVSSPQVEITSFATDTTVAPGTQFSLVLDVRPAKGVHVYAPGVTGYKPIALSLEAQPGVVTRNVQYPPPEDFHFKPLTSTSRSISNHFALCRTS